jgi:hypothetical protein
MPCIFHSIFHFRFLCRVPHMLALSHEGPVLHVGSWILFSSNTPQNKTRRFERSENSLFDSRVLSPDLNPRGCPTLQVPHPRFLRVGLGFLLHSGTLKLFHVLFIS